MTVNEASNFINATRSAFVKVCLGNIDNSQLEDLCGFIKSQMGYTSSVGALNQLYDRLKGDSSDHRYIYDYARAKSPNVARNESIAPSVANVLSEGGSVVTPKDARVHALAIIVALVDYIDLMNTVASNRDFSALGDKTWAELSSYGDAEDTIRYLNSQISN